MTQTSVPFGYAVLFLLASLLTPTAARPQSVNDPIPCSGEPWRRADDTTAAATFTRLALGLYALADSARGLLAAGDVAPGFLTSAAAVIHRAAAYAPDREPTLAAAARITYEAAALGEARMDTILGLRAECYAQRWALLAAKRNDSVSSRTALQVLTDIRNALQEERRAAAAERRLRRRP